MIDQTKPRYLFHDGDHGLAIDRKGRHYLVKLKSDSSFETHLGNISHNDVIGKSEGIRIKSSHGHWLIFVKPTMAEFIRIMPRIANIIYPKDLGAIITLADLFPGAKVLEAGCGSGSMTIAILRAIGETGHLSSYDIREDMINMAETNVAAIIPGNPPVDFKIGDVYKGTEELNLDRIILDLPEPWHILPHASKSLVPGGIILCFLPTILQVHKLVQELRKQKTFAMINTAEILMRPWHLSNRSVRPEQRMVGHTGFLTTARKVDAFDHETPQKL